jgi:hypothetical protein
MISQSKGSSEETDLPLPAEWIHVLEPRGGDGRVGVVEIFVVFSTNWRKMLHPESSNESRPDSGFRTGKATH